MGVLIMHDWGRLLALSSATYVIWAGIFALFYRKFFWDMVGGTLGPHGIIPGPNSAVFVMLIVKVPLIQIINIVNGILTFAIEWPLPIVKTGCPSLYRSFVARLVFYIWCSFVAMFPYQTIDAGVFYFITAIVYAQAIARNERMEDPEHEAGRGGRKAGEV